MMTVAKRCLILGGNGFIGSHLTDSLLARGYLVRCFDKQLAHGKGIKSLSHPNLELYQGDMLDDEDISDAISGCDVCFHLISATVPESSNADPICDFELNTLGTIRFLSHAAQSDLSKIIFVSSGGTIYGTPEHLPVPETHPTNPICSYGISKLAIEKYLALFQHTHGLEHTILRLANVYGERQSTQSGQGAVAVFMDKVIKGERVEIWGDGSVVRDYLHVADVIQALLATLEPMGEERIFNIGSGCGYSINELLATIENVTGRQANRSYLPSRSFDVHTSVLCSARAKTHLGWSAKISLEEGLERYLKWLSDNPDTQ